VPRRGSNRGLNLRPYPRGVTMIIWPQQIPSISILKLKTRILSLVMGPVQNLGWVRLFFCCLGRARSATYGFGKFPLKISNFSFFCPLDQKNLIGLGQKNTQATDRLASYLLLIKSKLGSNQGPSLHVTIFQLLDTSWLTPII